MVDERAYEHHISHTLSSFAEEVSSGPGWCAVASSLLAQVGLVAVSCMHLTFC